MRKLALVLAVCSVVALVPVGASAAIGYDACRHNPESAACADQRTADQRTITARLRPVLNTVYAIVGILAVIFIVVAGIRYTTSGGDPAKTKAAQQTLTYAIVGLIVAALAFAITNFVVGQLT